MSSISTRVQILTPDFLGRRPPPSLSHLFHLSHLSHLFLISLISLSSLSLSRLSVSRLSVSLLSLLSQEDPGKEPHIKDSSHFYGENVYSFGLLVFATLPFHPCLQKERRVFSYLAALHFPILER